MFIQLVFFFATSFTAILYYFKLFGLAYVFCFSYHYYKIALFTFQLFHVKIQEVHYMDDNRKSKRTSLSVESCDLSAVKTTPWREEANLLVSKARSGMEKYQSA